MRMIVYKALLKFAALDPEARAVILVAGAVFIACVCGLILWK